MPSTRAGATTTKRPDASNAPTPPPQSPSKRNKDAPIQAPTTPLPTPALDSPAINYNYAIGRGEMGVLSYEPYKSLILPFWAFRSVPVAQASSAALMQIFASYVARGDFVGADMTRKFVQMGMTRARRYANHKGGRKYGKEDGRVLEKWTGGDETETAKRREKEEASEVFKACWRRCIEDEAYQELKGRWQKEKKEWEKTAVKKEVKEEVKEEEEDDDD